MPDDINPDDVMAAVAAQMCRLWHWGEADCCTAACDVHQALTGIDPMTVARGAYGTAAGARLFVARRGGFVAAVQGILQEAGFARSPARPAAIGIVAQPLTTFGHALAICITPGRWAVKTMTGFGIVAQQEIAWSCPR